LTVLKKLNIQLYTTQKLHSWAFIAGKWRLVSTQNLYIIIYSSFIWITHIQILERTQMPSTSGWVRKLWHIHSNKRKSCWCVQQCRKLPENYAKWKQPIPEGHILRDPIFTTFLRWQNYSNGEQISSC
jgi:hypothetical protein